MLKRDACARAPSPLSPEHGRSCLLHPPVEEIEMDRPGEDLGVADTAFETGRALLVMLLARGGVIDPTPRARKLFRRPNAVSHPGGLFFFWPVGAPLSEQSIDPALTEGCGICR